MTTSVEAAKDSIRQLTAVLYDKARQDERFKRELIANPKEVVQREFGIRIPDSMDFRVHEQTPSSIILTLPMMPSSDELSDEDLEAVAGGKSSGPDMSSQVSANDNTTAQATSVAAVGGTAAGAAAAMAGVSAAAAAL